jgi:hypothetical protein
MAADDARFGVAPHAIRKDETTMSPLVSPALRPVPAAIAGLLIAASLAAQASSHREAPSITTTPKVDASDFYMFRSYEAGRTDYVTLIANYLPLQDAYGGPNYFSLDPNALYEIHIDNNGDAREDITFQFRFQNTLKGVTLPIGGKNVPIPLIQAGAVSGLKAAALNLNEAFTVDVVRGDRRGGTRTALTKVGAGGGASFDKPVDNIGNKTIADYPAYANQHVYTVAIPGCSQQGRVFVGQRRDPFAVNLGTIFDLVNAPVSVITDPANINAAPNTLASKNVTTLALEVHKDCLVAGNETVIGGWTTASLRQGQLLNPAPPAGHQTAAKAGGAWTQVSRLGMPLVNEVVIGLPAKDRFNASKPRDDGQFADYVTNPTLPALLEIALNLPNTAPKNLPRNDLVTTFLTGIPGVNKPANVTASEMLRLNTAIAPVAFAQQNRLGVVGEILRVGGPQNLSQAVDLAGYPNGRRPKDDVVDISLIAVMGGLCVANGSNNALQFGAECNPNNVPLGSTTFNLHDAVDQAVVPLLPGFPYLAHPLPGAQSAQ